jgi:hypothetical protein
MKKVFLSVLILTGTIFCVRAQDLITKLDGSEILVKVIEIDPTSVKYKLYDNQTGPTYVVPKSELFRIKYENGKIEVLTGPANSGTGVPVNSYPQQQQQQPQPQPQQQPQQPTTKTPPPFTQTPVTAQPYQATSTGYWKSDMQVKAPYLYQDYRKGSKLVKAGWWMIGGGFLLEGIGIAVSEKEEVERTSTYVKYQMKGPGAAIAVAGGISFVAGIPVMISGYVKKNSAKRNYLSRYGSMHKSPLQSPHFEIRTNGLAFVF